MLPVLHTVALFCLSSEQVPRKDLVAALPHSCCGLLLLALVGDAKAGDKEVPLDMKVNIVNDLLPSDLSYAGYDGSLTTPPCR